MMTPTTSPSYTVTLDIPREWWWSANDRIHWAEKARRTRWIRQAARVVADAARIPTMTIAHATVYVSYPRNGRADPHNVVSTVVKAAVDGIVDAGVLTDDDSTRLIGPDVRPAPPTGHTGTYRLRFVLVDQEVPS